MAKKDNNDELEDNNNKSRENDDINEADDSFGLPHVEYEPLENDDDEPREQHYQSEPVNEEVDTSGDDRYTSENAAIEEDNTYVPGSYVPPKDNSVLPKVLALIFVLVLAGAGVWYFGFYKPEQQAKERALQERQQQLEEQERRAAEQRAEQERLALEQARLAEEARKAAEAKPETGSVETISSRTGRYYVVIASAIDGDLAMDHAEELSKKGLNVSIIEPYGTTKFHRIAIDHRDTWAAAQHEANALKDEYGEGVWVIKY